MEIITFFLIPAIIAGQMSDAYLRFLSFRSQMPQDKIQQLWLLLVLCGLTSLLLYGGLLLHFGLSAGAYKALLMLGWVPYLLIFMAILPYRTAQHIFVFGMSAMWSLMQHNWSSLAAALLLPDFEDNVVIFAHACLYLLWFLLFLPLERHIFTRLLPHMELFQQKPLGVYLALMPLVLMSPPFFMLADGALWHTWEERLSRLYLPLAFLFLYRYELSVAEDFFDLEQKEREAWLLQEEISALKDGQRLRQEDLDRTRKLSKTFLASYERLEELLQKGKTKAAQELLRLQDKQLDSVSVGHFSDSPLINAVVSVYLSRAKAQGISISQKINLPRRLTTDENELAVLLGNLLENALQATVKETTREISLVIQHDGKGCALSLTNPCSHPLCLDEEGLPLSDRQGHGLGTVSLKLFLEKYRGYAVYEQQHGMVQLMMYWRDERL